MIVYNINIYNLTYLKDFCIVLFFSRGVVCACKSLCAWVSGTSVGQKRALDSLELEVQSVVIHYVGTRNLHHGAISSSVGFKGFLFNSEYMCMC